MVVEAIPLVAMNLAESEVGNTMEVVANRKVVEVVANRKVVEVVANRKVVVVVAHRKVVVDRSSFWTADW